MDEPSLYDSMHELFGVLDKETYSKTEVLKIICDCDYIMTNRIVKHQQIIIEKDKKILALVEEKMRLEDMM
ncbi:MAG: hypothetical protein ACM3O4_04455 [Ignavibacteriales bacterium]